MIFLSNKSQFFVNSVFVVKVKFTEERNGFVKADVIK